MGDQLLVPLVTISADSANKCCCCCCSCISSLLTQKLKIIVDDWINFPLKIENQSHTHNQYTFLILKLSLKMFDKHFHHFCVFWDQVMSTILSHFSTRSNKNIHLHWEIIDPYWANFFCGKITLRIFNI